VSILNSQIPEIKSQITDLLMKGSSNAKAVGSLKENLDWDVYAIAASNYLIAFLNASRLALRRHRHRRRRSLML
jgi:hypothetical protein